MWRDIFVSCWREIKWGLKMLGWIKPASRIAFEVDGVEQHIAGICMFGFFAGFALLFLGFGFALAPLVPNQGASWWPVGILFLLYYLLGFSVDHITWKKHKMRLFET